MNILIKLLKDIGLLSLAIIALGLVGAALNALIPWIWLTYFFVIIRTSAELFGFMIDLPTLYTTTGLLLTAYGFYWVWRASFLVIKWYKN